MDTYRDIALQYGVLPLEPEDGRLQFAASNPDSTQLQQEIQLMLGQPVALVYQSAEHIADGLEARYGERPVAASLAKAIETRIAAAGMTASEVVTVLLDGALEYRASDIHLEPAEFSLQTRFRIDGVLESGPALPTDLQAPVISHIKVLANLDIAEKRRPQDGKFQYGEIDLRVSTIPTVYGEKVVLRLLNRGDVQLDFASLGFSAREQAVFEDILQLKQGIVLVTGPTGSGKTTTLYSALHYLNTPTVNIVTVEDPIEYELAGLNQTQVHPQIGYTFANALRAFLRQDPDVIFVGEIRDTETAQIAIRASLTGHLVFSTIHTNNAIDTITRLIDMGIEPFLLASSLKLILAQRLVRRTCEECHGHPENSGSCVACRGTGYSGRVGIFELFPVTEQVQTLIHANTNRRHYEEAARAMDVEFLTDAARRLVQAGITTEAEVYRVLS